MPSVRLDWEAVPESVSDALCALFGATVLRAESIIGGFSPGLICSLDLSDGRQMFVKGCPGWLNGRTPSLHALEADVLRSLGTSVPHAPFVESIVSDDWTVVVTEFVGGTSGAETDLNPVEAGVLVRAIAAGHCVGVPRLEDKLASDFLWNGFARLDRAEVEPQPDWHIPAWVEKNWAELLRLEGQLPQILHGESLVHGDLRADNVMVPLGVPGQPSGRDSNGLLCAVDWPAAARGNSLFDAVLLAGSVSQVHGRNPAEFLGQMGDFSHADRTEASQVPQVPEVPEVPEIPALIAGFVGHYLWASSLPEPPGIAVRTYQRQLAGVFVDWLQTII